MASILLGKRKLVHPAAGAAAGPNSSASVWDELLQIPAGETRSYADIAQTHRLEPKAVRAVARANGDNFRGIIIPCHRVIGSDGSALPAMAADWRASSGCWTTKEAMKQ